LQLILATFESTRQNGSKETTERDRYVTSFCNQVTRQFLQYVQYV